MHSFSFWQVKTEKNWPKNFKQELKNLKIKSCNFQYIIKLTKAGNPPGFPCSIKTAVELSTGSYGHLAIPWPIPGTNSERGRCVRLDWKYKF